MVLLLAVTEHEQVFQLVSFCFSILKKSVFFCIFILHWYYLHILHYYFYYILILSSHSSLLHTFEITLTSDIRKSCLVFQIASRTTSTLSKRWAGGEEDCLIVESGISQLKFDFCCYQQQSKSNTLFYWILSWQTICCLITCLKSSFTWWEHVLSSLSQNYSTCKTIVLTELSWLYLCFKILKVLMPHLSISSVMIIFLPPFLPTM